MDKQEIQKQIDSISADRDALERTRNKLTGDIALLLQKIAEAEKPKLGHGDFGIDTDDEIGCGAFIVIEQASLVGTPKAFFENQSGLMHADEKMSSDLRFGNIFRLMEGWDKPFSRYEAVVMDSADGCDKVLIQPSSRSKDKIFIGSVLRGQRQLGIHLSEPELQEFWKQLGHALIFAKRSK